MKKTLFTLACAALVAPAFAGEAITEPITITLPESVTLTSTSKVGEDSAWQHGIYTEVTHQEDDPLPEDPNHKKTVVDKTSIEHFVTHYGTKGIGFYVGGNNNSYNNPGTNGEGTLTTTNNVASVVLDERNGVAGDNFAMVLSGSQLKDKVVNTLTLTGAGSTNNNNKLTLGGTFVVAVYNGTEVVSYNTALLSAVNTDESVTTTLTLPNVTFTDGHKIMIGYISEGKNTSAGATTPYTISNIQLTAAPEPATATLSLLALAGLASRRRRH